MTASDTSNSSQPAPEGRGNKPPGGLLGRLNLDLIALAAIVLVLNAVYFRPDFIPVHDTKGAYVGFHYFYNSFYHSGQLPQWAPYGTYGATTVASALSLTPSNYFFILLGAAVRIPDSLLMYKASTVAEQWFLLLGVFLLARRLYAHRLTVFLVSLTAVASTVWYYQVHFNFHIYYHLPMVLYFLHRFFTERRGVFAFLAALVLCVSVLGGCYFAPAWVMALVPLVLILLIGNWGTLRCLLRPSIGAILTLILLAGTCAAIWTAVAHSMEGLTCYTQGRDADTHHATLEYFLVYPAKPPTETHRGNPGLPGEALLWDFLNTPTMSRDITLYIGLIPLAGFLVALFTVRDRWFWALAGGAGALIAISLGGVAAYLIYHVPGMALYRHVSYLQGTAKIFLLLAGGFGIDRILAVLRDGRELRRWFSTPALLTLLAVLWLAFDLHVGQSVRLRLLDSPDAKLKHLLTFTLAIAAIQYGAIAFAAVLFWRLGRVAGLVPASAAGLSPATPGTAHPLCPPRLGRLRPAHILAAVLVLDCLLFQCQVWRDRPHGPHDLYEPGMHLSSKPLRYCPSRLGVMDPKTARRDAGLLGNGDIYYSFYYNAIEFDPWFPAAHARLDYLPAGVHDLITARGGVPRLHPQNDFLPEDDAALRTVLGCDTPKLRVFTFPLYADSYREALDWVAHPPPALDQQVVLSDVPQEYRRPALNPRPVGDGPPVTVEHFTANRLEVEATVEGNAPAWLVYADAWHPAWHASVNGKAVPVARAYLGFKAVPLEKGLNRVTFWFFDGLCTVALYGLAVLAAAFFLVFLIAFARISFRKA